MLTACVDTYLRKCKIGDWLYLEHVKEIPWSNHETFHKSVCRIDFVNVEPPLGRVDKNYFLSDGNYKDIIGRDDRKLEARAFFTSNIRYLQRITKQQAWRLFRYMLPDMDEDVEELDTEDDSEEDILGQQEQEEEEEEEDEEDLRDTDEEGVHDLEEQEEQEEDLGDTDEEDVHDQEEHEEEDLGYDEEE
jgi:hypothetical protein